MLPAPLASTTITLWHVRTSFWRGARDFFGRGGVLYLSCSADVAIPEMDELAGCRLADRAPFDGDPVLRFVRPWGPFGVGEELLLPAGDGTLAERGVRLRASDAETVAVGRDGEPALVVVGRGSGTAVTCAYPVETLMAGRPDAHGPRDRTWGLYAGLAHLVPRAGQAGCADPDVALGELRGPGGGVLTLTNHSDRPITTTVGLPEGATRLEPLIPTSRDAGGSTVALEPYGAAVAVWRSEG
jgi:hypothetical protein